MTEFWERRYRKRGMEWGEEPSLAGRAAAAYLRERPGSKVLDVGCGYGRDCFYLAAQGHEVVGLDVSCTALAIGEKWRSRAGITGVSFICAPIEKHTFARESFDAVVSYNVMQMFDKAIREKIVRELTELLKPRGLLVQALFSTREEGYGEGALLERNSFLGKGGRLRHFFDREELEELFSGYNFLHLAEVTIPEQQVDKPPHFHQEWLMVLEKAVP